jgi:hypothetical protein
MNLYIITYQFYDSDEKFKSYIMAESEYDAKTKVYHSHNIKPMIINTHQLTYQERIKYEISTRNDN